MTNFSWLFFFNTLGYAFSLITFPILIHKFGLEEIGAVFMVQALIFGMASIANYSFVYFIPTVSKKVTENQTYFIKLWNVVLYTRTSLSLLLAVLSIGIVHFFYPHYFMLWLLSLPLLIPKIINPALFCNALETNHFVFKIGFCSKLLFLILISFATKSIYVNSFLALSEIVAILWYLKRINSGFFKFQLLSFSDLIRFLKQTRSLFLVNIVSLLKPHSTLPIIGYVFGNTYVALFAIAEKVINSIRGISGMLFVSYFPMYNKNDIKVKVISLKVLMSTLILSALFIVCFWYLSPHIVYFLNDFKPSELATSALQIMSLSIPLFFLIIPLFSYVLNKKKWNVILYFAIVQLVFFIGFLLIWIDENIIGVAQSLVVSEYAIVLCYAFYWYRRVQTEALNSKR
ncbi:hypothetical protein OE09_1968 [Flavobacteriaceae bacterium MAR_2010_72]|nr:hypothetical protein OE09_1968 [Flavobacteriaceae bacterium MAR_2010_72]TVZ59321.1 hypothetical protein NA63_1849 [Flavobacteriaceae bacterium MAR_2010_105]